MSMPKKQFEGWFRSQLFLMTDEGQCKKFVLRHVTAASRMGQAVMTIPVPNDVNNEEGICDAWIHDTCKSIEETAQSDADGCGGLNSYLVFSYHGDKAEKASNRFALKFTGINDVEDDEVASEAPTKAGLISQLMRHTEAIMRTSTITQANALQSMARNQQRLEAEVEKLLTERFENFTLVETLLSAKEERELERAKAMQEIEMKEKMMDKVMLLAPLALNKFMGNKNGQKALPEATTPVEQQLASLAQSLTPEQLENIAKVLSPEQSMSFVDVFMTVQKKQNSLLQKTNEEPQK